MFRGRSLGVGVKAWGRDVRGRGGRSRKLGGKEVSRVGFADGWRVIQRMVGMKEQRKRVMYLSRGRERVLEAGMAGRDGGVGGCMGAVEYVERDTYVRVRWTRC